MFDKYLPSYFSDVCRKIRYVWNPKLRSQRNLLHSLERVGKPLILIFYFTVFLLLNSHLYPLYVPLLENVSNSSALSGILKYSFYFFYILYFITSFTISFNLYLIQNRILKCLFPNRNFKFWCQISFSKHPDPLKQFLIPNNKRKH